MLSSGPPASKSHCARRAANAVRSAADACRTIHDGKDQGTERRTEARRTIHNSIDQFVGDLLCEGRPPVTMQAVLGVGRIQHRLARGVRDGPHEGCNGESANC